MVLRSDAPKYRKRQLVETQFSILKRKFGSDLKARIFRVQRNEIVNKMIVSNIHRFLQFLWVKVFYRADCCMILWRRVLNFSGFLNYSDTRTLFIVFSGSFLISCSQILMTVHPNSVRI